MSKPNKRQKAILQLLNIIDQEGLHYGFVNYGVDDQLKAIKDKELTNLVSSLNEITEKLEEYLTDLKEEVQLFIDDDSDF
jgi:hypothetical protein